MSATSTTPGATGTVKAPPPPKVPSERMGPPAHPPGPRSTILHVPTVDGPLAACAGWTQAIPAKSKPATNKPKGNNLRVMLTPFFGEFPLLPQLEVLQRAKQGLWQTTP